MNINENFLIYKNKVLGKGAYSTVYLGLNVDTKKRIAIKLIPIKNFKKKTLKKIKKETIILKSLSHKNICNMIDCFQIRLNYYIIFEYCNSNLLNYIKNKITINESTTHNFMIQLSNALFYLQEKSISHRDIKPQNILMNNNVLKLSDFGLACSFIECNTMKTICGSPLYMAPEIINNNEYCSKIDLWSIGIVMYQMLFGKTPFTATSHYELINIINHSNVVYPSNDLSPKCIDLMNNLLKKDPQERISWIDFFDHPFLSEHHSSRSISKPIPIPKKY